MIKNDSVFLTLKENILNGIYPTGSKLPPERHLSEKFGVSRVTIRMALKKLSQEGWLNRVQGSGNFVSYGWSSPVSVRRRVLILHSEHHKNISSDPFYLQTMGGILEVFSSHAIDIRYERGCNNSSLKDIQGAICFGDDIPQQDSDLLKSLKIPHVIMGHNDSQSDASHVDIDNHSGGYQVARHLLQLGRKRIALIDESEQRWHVRDRLSGIRSAYTEFNLSIPENLHFAIEGLKVDQDLQRLKQWFQSEDFQSVDALVIHSNWVMSEVMCWFRQNNKNIPEHKSIISYDDDAWFEAYSPWNITSLRQPFYEMGKELAEMLLELIDQPNHPRRIKTLQPFLVIRGSCGMVKNI